MFIVGLVEASEREASREIPKESQLNARENMRRTTIVLACVLFVPVAFAQTRTTKTQQAATAQRTATQMSTSKGAIGTVISFTPGKTVVVPSSPIVVQSSPNVRPVSYVLGRKVRYVDQAGKAVDPRNIRAGTRVHLDFDRAGAVRRVVVVGKG
jgi:hypothetical protein